MQSEKIVVCQICKSPGHLWEQCPEHIESRIIAKRERDEWNSLHERCPVCLGVSLSQTLAGPVHIVGEGYQDDINRAYCDCGWSGKVNQLVP